MRTAEEFYALVHRGESCWTWRGGHNYRRGGVRSYAVLNWRGKVKGAHRVMWELTNGPIPDGKFVLHLCDNQWCIRPDHLYIGTHEDNTRDAVMRHRIAVGERQGVHKLTEAEVVAIRAMAAAGVATETIGPIFGVSGSNVRQIVRRDYWKHI